MFGMNPFEMVFAGFPLLALLAGTAAGAITRRAWSGLFAGVLVTVVLAFTVANTTLLWWTPAYALVGWLGGLLGTGLRNRVAGR